MKSKQITIPRTKWMIDHSHSEIVFKVKHLMINMVRGFFREYDAGIYTTGDDFTTARIEVTIDPASVDTHDEVRDKHLKGPDFFDTGNHKTILFRGKKVEQVWSGFYSLSGELTIKGITKPVTLEVDFGGSVPDLEGNIKAGFSVKGRIDRRDWNLIWNAPLETGGFLVGDYVLINAEVQLTKKNDDIIPGSKL